MKKGIFCISIDTELLWGRNPSKWQEFYPRAKKVRLIVKRLLKLFEKYQIPATWAIVGNLYLEPTADKYSNFLHSPDIIRDIRKYKNQEIGCHSFSHPDFDKISKKEAEKEVVVEEAPKPVRRPGMMIVKKHKAS